MELFLLLLPAVVLPIGLSLAGLWWLLAGGEEEDEWGDDEDDSSGGEF